MVDRTKMSDIDQERNLQRSEDFIDGKVVEQGKGLGAQYLITGNVNSYSNDGEVCKMNFSINVVDVATGQIINTTTIDTKKGDHSKKIGKAGLLAGGLIIASHIPVMGMAAMASAGSMAGGQPATTNVNKTNKVFQRSLSDISPQIQEFVDDNFPAIYSVVKIEKKSKKGKALSLLVACGRETGLEEGRELKIVKLTEVEVNGKKVIRRQQIGMASIEKIEDQNFSICTVTDESEDIAANMEAKAQIQVMTFTQN